MSFKILPKAAVQDWVRQVQRDHRVVGPVAKHGKFVFDEIKDPSALELDYPTSVLPPKKYLLPPREPLFEFKKNGAHKVEVKLETTPTVILGVHTCDLHAIHLLDKINNTGYADQHYQSRRKHTLLVSIECLKPCMPGSFCKSMGTLSVTEGYDLHLTDLGDAYAVDVGSEEGAKLLNGNHAVFDAQPEDLGKMNRVMAGKWPKFSYRLEFDVTELPDLLRLGFKSDLWEELGERCLACGMCTKVCPTCYCFDVQDEMNLTQDEGTRWRVWDSCQIDPFAVVAGGHNFRESRAHRQRHRFMRKGRYQAEAFGLIGCVGCGRCAEACLVDITPVGTFNELYRRHFKGEKAKEVGA